MGNREIYDARGLRFKDWSGDAPSHVCSDDKMTACSLDESGASDCASGADCVPAEGASNVRYRIYADNGQLKMSSGLTVNGPTQLNGGLGGSLNMDYHEAYNVKGLRFTDWAKVCANDSEVSCTDANAASVCGEGVACVIHPDSEGYNEKYRIWAANDELNSKSSLNVRGTLTAERVVAEADGIEHFKAEGVKGTVPGTAAHGGGAPFWMKRAAT